MKELNFYGLNYLIVLLISVFLGVSLVFLPIQYMIAFLMIPVFLILAWQYSIYAVFALFLILFGVLPASYLPKLSIGGGTLRAEDLGLMVLFTILALKLFLDRTDSRIEFWAKFKPYMIPLIGLLFFAVLSVLISILYKTAPVKHVFTEFRPYLSWLIIPILFMSVDSLKKFIHFKKMLVILVLLMSFMVIFESLTGIPLSDKGQEVRALWTSGEGNFSSVNRSTTPGIFLMASVLIYLISLYVFQKNDKTYLLAYLIIGAILSLGVLVGFGRGIWLSIALMIILLGFVKPGRAYLQLIMWLIMTASILIYILFIVKPAYVDAASNRLFSISSEIKSGASLDRRFIENKYAVIKIVENPILGVGLGGQYKPAGIESLTWPDEVRYIHNAYVNVLTKLGFFGLFFIIYLVIVIFIRTYKAYHSQDHDKPIVYAAFSLFMSTIVITGFTQPNLISPGGIVSISIAIYFIESVFRGMPYGTDQ